MIDKHPHHAQMSSTPQWLSGQLLIAAPSLVDSTFTRSVVFICTHNEDGAMGLVINQLYGALSFSSLLAQLDISLATDAADIDVHCGGPVDTGRGFVLHSTDYSSETTGPITADIALTATVEILKDMATGGGPRHALLALGYAAWSAGQLEDELQQNGWFVAPTDLGLIFTGGVNTKWERALASLGTVPAQFSLQSGNA
jgi:putative transcriptional regulator